MSHPVYDYLYYPYNIHSSDLGHMRITTSTNPPVTHTDQEQHACLITIIQDKNIIFLSFVISLLIHIAFFIQFSGVKHEHDKEMPVSHSINIILNKEVPDQAPQDQEEIKPVKRETTAPAKTKPVINDKEKLIEEKIEEVAKEKPIERKQFIPSQPNNLPSDQALLDNEKKQYLELIAAHLDKHKFYPRSARRRHIGGDVKVSFDLMKDGNILNLKVFSGHSVLQEATLESVNSALPMPQRPESLMTLNTIKIEYTMQYAIK